MSKKNVKYVELPSWTVPTPKTCKKCDLLQFQLKSLNVQIKYF